MQIQTTFQYTPADYRELADFIQGRTPAKRQIRPLFLYIVFGMFIVGLIYLQFRSKPTNGMPRSNPLFLIAVVVAFLLVAARRGLFKVKPRVADEVSTLTATAQSIRLVGSVSRTEFDWAAFSSIKESPNLFLLQLANGPASYLIVPKRALSSGDAIAFRELAETHIGSPVRAFPVIPISPAASSDQ